MEKKSAAASLESELCEILSKVFVVAAVAVFGGVGSLFCQNVFPGSEPHCWTVRDALPLGRLPFGQRGRVVAKRDNLPRQMQENYNLRGSQVQHMSRIAFTLHTHFPGAGRRLQHPGRGF